MNTTIVAASILAVSVLAGGCASTTKLDAARNSLVDSENKIKISIPQKIAYIDPAKNFLQNNIEVGILPGIYILQKENSDGQYFFGEGRSFFMRVLPSGAYELQKGGFWAPKDPTQPVRLFFMLGYSQIVKDLPTGIPESSNGTSDVDTTRGVDAALTNKLIAAPVPAAAIGAGIGTGIVAGMVASEMKKPVLMDAPPDRSVDTLIRSAIRSQVGN